jgi:hypothetical protein
MHVDLQATVAFHLTGERTGTGLGPIEEPGLRPALLAAYRDLARLRYDFPLVLAHDASGEASVEPLSRRIDRALEAAAADRDADRLRAHALRVEREVRAMAAAGTNGSLHALLGEAACRVAAPPPQELRESLDRLRAALGPDGEVVDCGTEMPARMLAHVWQDVQRRKSAAFHRQLARLVQRLGDILRGDAARSESARGAAGLAASVGAGDREAFDFDAMSRILARKPSGGTLTPSRRRRIEATLAALESQRFFAEDPGAAQAFEFRFEDCASALAAFRERVPLMAALARAITIARLEIDGEYSEPRHDALFERIGESSLGLRDMTMFPDYLVCLNARQLRATGLGELMELLASGLPVKILVQSDDLLEPPLVEAGHLAFGARSRQFANMALGLNDVYVLQASASHLARLRDRIHQAMHYGGPALFSVFSGATGHCGGLPPYLVAAAANESRAFPAFVYDPAAGPDWASRFSLEHNPQAGRDWPLHALRYEDAEHQRVAEEVAFTLLDFVACDRRYAGHFAKVPRASWSAALAPAAECLARESRGVPERLPSLLIVDGENRLQRVVVDDRLMREARRCLDQWRSLRELGGIGNSHVERALAREHRKAEESKPAEVKQAPEAPAPTAPAPAEAEKTRASDEPYIETPRCSSCDECVQLNNRMFAYNENKQARIVDAAAGTYRELVEAAESCQVAIIHPGKPRNPDEPGLEDLLKRAEPFR